MILSHGAELIRLGCTVKEYIKMKKLPVFYEDTRYREFDDEIREGSSVLIGCGDPDKVEWIPYGAGSIAQVTNVYRGSVQYVDLKLVNGDYHQHNINRIAHIRENIVFLLDQCDRCIGKFSLGKIGFKDFWLSIMKEENFKYLRYIGLMLKQKASDGSDLYKIDRDRLDNLGIALGESYTRNDRGYVKSLRGQYLTSNTCTEHLASKNKDIDAMFKDTKVKMLPSCNVYGSRPVLLEFDYPTDERKVSVRFDGGDSIGVKSISVQASELSLPKCDALNEFYDMFKASKYFGPDPFEFVPAAAYIMLAGCKRANKRPLSLAHERCTDLTYAIAEYSDGDTDREGRHEKALRLLSTLLFFFLVSHKDPPIEEIEKWVEHFRGK